MDENKAIVEAGKLLQKIPGFRGRIYFNIQPDRDYVNVNIEKALAFEYTGEQIKNLNKRKTK